MSPEDENKLLKAEVQELAKKVWALEGRKDLLETQLVRSRKDHDIAIAEADQWRKHIAHCRPIPYGEPDRYAVEFGLSAFYSMLPETRAKFIKQEYCRFMMMIMRKMSGEETLKEILSNDKM